MNTVSTRRTILVGAATLPALSLPAIAEFNQDAELLALGKQFDALEIEYREERIRNAGYYEAEQAALRRMRDHQARLSNGEFAALFDKEMEGAPKQSHPTWEEIVDRMDPVQRRISKLPAKTLEGLKVKARSAKQACSHFWEAENLDDAGWDHRIARTTIDAILAISS